MRKRSAVVDALEGTDDFSLPLFPVRGFCREPFICCKYLLQVYFTLRPKRLVNKISYVSSSKQTASPWPKRPSCAVQWIMFLTRLLSKT